MRLVEIRLLEGPNLYRLEPAVKVEVALAAAADWHGPRDDGEAVATWMWTPAPSRKQPPDVARLAAWATRLGAVAGMGDAETGERDPGVAAPPTGGAGDVTVHRAGDPGQWVVAYPWRAAGPARALAKAAWEFAAAGTDPDPAATPDDAPAVAAARTRISAATGAEATAPAMLPDAARRVPIVSISGTNGKSTVTRLISTILGSAGRRVGMTTSDGILVNGQMVEPGDWTGPGGAAAILGRGDIDVAVLETARGGILLRGVGYESNEASVLTNVSSDHLDLQGIHTLAELTATKATICRITRPDGWVVLNAEDPHVAAVAGLVGASVAFFALDPDHCDIFLGHMERGGRGYAIRRGSLVESEAGETHEVCAVDEIPITLYGLARHNVANALAAAGGARALGASLADVAAGLTGFEPTADRSPGRLNLFRLGHRVVIVDYAHNEAGTAALLDVAEGIAAGGSARTWPISLIVGAAGDRPSDTLRGIGRIAGARADRVAIKETPEYLRGRPREWVVAELRAGLAEAGRDPDAAPVYETEVAALRGEFAAMSASDGRPEAPRVIALMCHSEREAVLALLDELGATRLSSRAELRALVHG